MNIHERALKLSRSSGRPLTEAYRELSRRGQIVRRSKKTPTETKPTIYWWQKET